MKSTTEVSEMVMEWKMKTFTVPLEDMDFDLNTNKDLLCTKSKDAGKGQKTDSIMPRGTDCVSICSERSVYVQYKSTFRDTGTTAATT